jgi:bifunctional UDP-N-acetylglucosamine pyrophosphorylase/glucosamine-1-phosphate N-acetyltransferase
MSEKCAVILAAGHGSKMRSDKPKALEKVLFRPMIDRVLQAVKEAGIEKICVVTGYRSDLIREHLGDSVEYALQDQPTGTGGAVAAALPFIEKTGAENVFIVNADTPFIDEMTVTDALEALDETSSSVTIISAVLDDPLGYGRVVRDIYDQLIKVVEQRDADDKERSIKEVNSGAYWFRAADLAYAVSKLTQHDDGGNPPEKTGYYISDAVEILMQNGKKAFPVMTDNINFVRKAHDRIQLNDLNDIARREVIRHQLVSGVEIPCTDGVIIADDVTIGAGTVIYPNTIIKDGSVIGCNCEIGPNCFITGSDIKDFVKLDNVKCEDSIIEQGADLGPFSHVRPGSRVGEHVHVGNFVEIKNSQIGNGTKVPHLTYVGDSDIGQGVNFGCGSLTVNYDGKVKSRTTVKDHAFIGCNTNLIAPVTVGEYAYTAAGSTITEDIPDYSLSIARARQINKINWVSVKKPFKGME